MCGRRWTRAARANIARTSSAGSHRSKVRFGFEFKDLRIAPGEGAAFCHYLALVSGARPGGRTSGYWVRGTTCFEQRDGQWLVTHEHISMPAPM